MVMLIGTITLVAQTRTGIGIFSYSLDGKNFKDIAEKFQAEAGQAIGAKIGLFCTRQDQINDSGFVDAEWFSIDP